MASSRPLVSVVMPVYNAAEYVAESIESILAQSYDHLEFVIVNDGSADRSDEIIRSFRDPRIKYVDHARSGLPGALNVGLAHATGPLIARHDADDVSLKDRLMIQVDHMERHPEIGLLGAGAIVTDIEGKAHKVMRHPEEHHHIAYELMWDVPIVHPSVVFRRSVLELTGPYSLDTRVHEDHEMWSRMVLVTKAANIPVDVVRYREVPMSVSRVPGREQRLLVQRRANLRSRLPEITAEQLELLAHSGFRHDRVDLRQWRSLQALMRTLIDRIGGSPSEREPLYRDARARLMGFRLNEHTGWISRAADRIRRSLLIQRWP